MSMIVFNRGQFIYIGDDGRRRLLFNVNEIYENHSAVSMNQHLVTSYGSVRVKEPFKELLLKHVETLKGIKEGQTGYISLLLLLLNDLWKKPYPVQVMRVGGASTDLFSVEFAKILSEFHSDSLLCCMCDDDRRITTEKNILSLPKDMKGVKLMQRQFSILILDDINGDLSTELVAKVLPSLRPFGHFFCLTERESMMEACQRVLGGVEKMHMDKAVWLLEQELSQADWERCYLTMPEGKRAQEKVVMELDLKSLGLEIKALESMDGKQVELLLQHAKVFELSLAKIYPALVSVDAKMLATQFREALIDWHLGNADAQRVRASFAALREDLLRHHDIPDGKEFLGGCFSC